MLEARIKKAVVVKDPKTNGTVLFGIAEYYGEMVNFKVAYSWEEIDFSGFCEDLKEQLAADFGLPTYRIDLQERKLAETMAYFHEVFRSN